VRPSGDGCARLNKVAHAMNLHTIEVALVLRSYARAVSINEEGRGEESAQCRIYNR
jgi:hypothetical protein